MQEHCHSLEQRVCRGHKWRWLSAHRHAPGMHPGYKEAQNSIQDNHFDSLSATVISQRDGHVTQADKAFSDSCWMWRAFTCLVVEL